MSTLKEALFDAAYITVPEMAMESGQSLSTIYNWLRYHNYFDHERVEGRVVISPLSVGESQRTQQGI